MPPPVGGQHRVELNFSLEMKKILKINEVEGTFRTRFVIRRQWLDPRLSYRNLKKESRVNLISPSEASTIWFPQMVFENIPSDVDWIEIVENEEYNIVRNAEGNFDPIEVTDIDNAFIFSGDENSHYLSKEFTVLWNCDFNMMWYPFDTQTCPMQLKIINEFAEGVKLNPQHLAYSGPTDLSQYMVIRSIMCEASIGEYEGVEVNISLGRPLISDILTVFIPTIILLTISHISKVFDERYIDMVVMVNLTVLLVLATL